MTVTSGPGCLSQVNGRIAGSCENASTPGLAFSGRGGLQVGQDVKRAGQQPPGDGHGGDLPAAAVGELGVGVGEQGAALGGLGGLLQEASAPTVSPAW
jgi:hypothetical protein